jgi:hypothetical protein
LDCEKCPTPCAAPVGVEDEAGFHVDKEPQHKEPPPARMTEAEHNRFPGGRWASRK